MGSIKLSYRIAGEKQLLTEEKWIISTLANTKKQRNCLQIERLHFESMKAKLKQSEHGPKPVNKPVSPATSSERLPQRLPQNPRHFSSIAELRTDTNEPLPVDTSCNIEELDLTVSKSVFDQENNPEFCAEEEEEEDDENTCDDVFLDMSMLMCGKDE